MEKTLDQLLVDINACQLCSSKLPLGPRPVVQLSENAKILIAGQAPGTRVHETGIPFNDPSGDRLREWMGVSKDIFYDRQKVNILPMGFCYPGRAKSGGDLPPRPECAKEWRAKILALLSKQTLILVIGQYALNYHLGDTVKKNLTETVKAWREYPDGCMPLPHPSPRNNIWLKKNEWFAEDVLPELRRRVLQAIEKS